MTSVEIARLCPQRVDFFRPDGTTMDLAQPQACEVDFNEIAFGLSKLARFTGTYAGMAYSVAQHSVMGAEALLNEGETEITAALFLLHDGHEYKLGDDSRPKVSLIHAMMAETSPVAAELYRRSVDRAKARWDVAIYSAAGLPTPDRWTNHQRHTAHSMDMRMAAAEAEALFGSKARRDYPLRRFPAPRTRGSITPWGAAKAEIRFLETFDRLIGKAKRMDAANLHAVHLALEA